MNPVRLRKLCEEIALDISGLIERWGSFYHYGNDGDTEDEHEIPFFKKSLATDLADLITFIVDNEAP